MLEQQARQSSTGGDMHVLLWPCSEAEAWRTASKAGEASLGVLNLSGHGKLPCMWPGSSTSTAPASCRAAAPASDVRASCPAAAHASSCAGPGAAASLSSSWGACASSRAGAQVGVPARHNTSRQALSCTGNHRALLRQQHILIVQLPAASGGAACTGSLAYGLPGSPTLCGIEHKV